MYFAAKWIALKGHGAYTGLNPDERAQLSKLVSKSKGRPSNLSKGEREKVGELVRKAAAAARAR